MSRAHLYRAATDSAGNVVPNVQVTVYQAGTTQTLNQTLYTANSGSTSLTNPFTSSNGIIDFYLDQSQSIKIGMNTGNGEQQVDNIEVVPAPENLVQAVNGFAIVNTPAAGQFLQSTDVGEATWIDSADLISTKPSPLAGLRNYDFSSSSLSDLTAQDSRGNPVSVSYVSTSSDTLPSGWSFTKALQVPVTDIVVLRTPVLDFPESGFITFLYKIVATDSPSAASLRVSVDAGSLSMAASNDPSLINTWMVGYLGDIPTGTHTVRIDHTPGLSPVSHVLMGPVVIQYGNNIPFHTHEGSGIGSTMLGPNAMANFDRSSVIGGNATATGTDATVYGYSASGGQAATALGSYASAAPSGIAVGYYSTNLTGTQGGVAVGYTAQTLADDAVAVGSLAQATGARGIAVGSSALASGTESVALGPSTTASAPDSVALGANATVGSGHGGSLALGAGAQTTTANQAMIGTSAMATVIAGALTVNGNSVIGSSSGTVGFFGSSGASQPIITGSRGGNIMVAELLSALDTLGIINDASTT